MNAIIWSIITLITIGMMAFLYFRPLQAILGAAISVGLLILVLILEKIFSKERGYKKLN